MNDTLQAIFDRRSIRNFTAQPLTREQLDTLAEVALASPTGMNLQPWLFHFITDPAVIAAISDATVEAFRQAGNQTMLDRIASRHASIYYGAPLVVCISMPKDNLSGVDAGIAVANLAVAAQSMGLGSCIIGMAAVGFGSARGPELARLIGMPEDRALVISVAIGSPAVSKEAHERHPEKIMFI